MIGAGNDRQVLYEDNYIKAVFLEGAEGTLLITFGDAITFANGVSFFGDTPLQKAGFSAIGFMAKGPNWFPASSIRKAHPYIEKHLSRYDRRITYGGSMGGYAAVKYSRLFDADTVISLCPQWTIDPTKCEGNAPDWQGNFNPTLEGMEIGADDTRGRVFLFADPAWPIDVYHRLKIAQACAEFAKIDVRFSDHNITGMLSGTANLQSLIDGCARNDVEGLRLLANRIRRQSGMRRVVVLKRLFQRNKNRGAEAIAVSVKADAGLYYHLPSDEVAKTLIRSGSPRAADFISGMIAVTPDPSSRIGLNVLLSNLTKKPQNIRTAHGTSIVFDIVSGRAAHVDDESLNRDRLLHVNVRAGMAGGSVRLFAQFGSADIELGVDSAGSLRLLRKDNEGEKLTFGLQHNGYFNFISNERYLSADPYGNIAFNRPVADLWESFQVT